jgi:hypothetical protein
MDKVFNSVVFPPQCGGQHLAIMLSTAYPYDRDKYLEVYNAMGANVDNWSSIYSQCPVKSYHIQGFTIEYTKERYPYQRVFVLSAPTKKDSIAYQRMVKFSRFMDNDYLIELVNMLYSKDYVAKLHNIPEHHILEINSDDFIRADITNILQTIAHQLPIDIAFCQSLHSAWFTKLLNTIQT